ncbi:MAG TPA: aldo/keto reductase [Candidatus Binataceae bacterium]|nr:aldo/keto reductase [Candidatus Binataceae bacterium]
MEYRNLGNSGLKVSVVGIGCNNFGGRADFAQTRAVVEQALTEGITLFDTADVYGNQKSEELLGQALGNRRHEVIIATKFGSPTGAGPYQRGASRRYIFRAVEASLRRLGTDYIDLYQIHQPDPDTPEQETLEALTDLVRAGKVRYVGCSNYAGWRLAESVHLARERGLSSYIAAQNEYSLLKRDIETELIPACRHYNVGILPYFPLASGVLTGKYRRGAEPPADTRMSKAPALRQRMMNDTNLAIVDKLAQFTRRCGHSMVELAMSWLACQPQVSSVIAGAMNAEQVRQNANSAGWRLSAEELAEIDRITRTPPG